MRRTSWPCLALTAVLLAGCSAVDVLHIMQKQRQTLEDLDIEVTGTRADAVPAVFTAIPTTSPQDSATTDVVHHLRDHCCTGRLVGPLHRRLLDRHDAEFDAAFERIRKRGIEFWADPARTQPGKINHHFGGRGVYFHDPDRHLMELITQPYGTEAALGA